MFKKITPVLITMAFFLTNVTYAAAGSYLRVPMTASKRIKEAIDKTNNSSSTNPFLLFKEGRDRGNLTIDKKTIFIGMGGGDTAGLNDFVADTVERLTKLGYRVIGIRNGFKGFLRGTNLEDNLVELTPEIAASMKGLPSMVLGSCREKLKEEDIAKIVSILKPSAGAIFIGGNDHLKNVEQVADEAGKQGIDITVVGVPKSIDNDFMTAMHGFWSAVITGRQMAARASINPEKEGTNTAAVFECMGRKSGSLTLEISKGCPYSHVVVVPEKPVMIDDIINASNNGVRNFFVSEGFSLSEADPKLSLLLEAYPILKAMWEKSRTSPDRDAHGNPKLTGASLFVKGILKNFCGLDVEKTDLTYQLRGAFLQADNKGVIFDVFLADKFSEEAVSLVETKQSGFAVAYDGGYGNTKGEVKAKLPKEVYKSIDLSSTVSDESLAGLGVLGVPGYSIEYNQSPELYSDKDVTLEDAIRKAFYGIAASTYAHRYASVVEFREPSDIIIASCGKDQDSLDKLPNDLRAVIEGTRESVLLLIPEKQQSLSQIADNIKEISDKSGYINMAISKDFMLDPKDELLENVLKTDPVLRVKFNKEGIVDGNTGMVRFESGVSNFMVGLYKYLIKQGKIKVEGTKITDLGYAFKGLERSSVLDAPKREALDSGV
jgi:6-phosphofructokinase